MEPVDAERRESVDWTRLVQQVVAYQRVRRQRVPTTRYDTIRYEHGMGVRTNGVNRIRIGWNKFRHAVGTTAY